MKKYLKNVFLILGIGFTAALFSCAGQQNPPKPANDYFSISCDKNDFFLDEDKSITFSIANDYVLQNHNVENAIFTIDHNDCGATISKNGNNWIFKATTYGSAIVYAKIEDLKSTNSISIKAFYSDNKIKENFQSVLNLDGGVVFGQSYDLGLSKTYDANYTLSGAEGILKINDLGLLEVEGIGQGKVKLLKDNVELMECRYTVFNSTLATKIKRDLINKGIIENLSSLVPNSLLSNIVELNMRGELINDPNATYGIKYLSNLERLDLSANNLSDISFISTLSNIKELNLSDNLFTDISSIVENENLVLLNLKNNKITKITNLQYLYKIEQLDLSDNCIVNISPLSSLYSLKSLMLNNNKVENFKDSLSGLENLKELGLGNCGISFNDIVSLKYLPNIEYLDITGTKPTLKIIGNNLKKLKTLILDNCALDDLSGNDSLDYLNELVNLESLNIANNDLDLEKWTGIDGLPFIKGENFVHLRELYIGGNAFNSFPSLEAYSSLELLDVTDSYNLSSIATLANLNIGTLILDNCNSISDSNFADLILSNTNIKKISTIGGFNYLTRDSYNKLLSAVNNGTISWRFMNDVWTTKDTISNYSKLVYFSMSDLLLSGVNSINLEANEYQFKKENGEEIIISFVNDLDNLSSTHYIFSIPKELYRIQIYGNKYYSYNISFNIKERKESSLTFNLYNFKDNVSEKNGDVIKAPLGSKTIINALAGENTLRGGNGYVKRGNYDTAIITAAGSAFNGYDITVKTSNNASISLIGGNGGKGPNCFESPLYDGQTPWAGVDAGDGADAIKCHDCELFGKNININGGNGGNGGNSNSGTFNPQHTGSGGNGGHGIYYSGVVADESTSNISGGKGGKKGTGGNVSNNPHDGVDGASLRKGN